MQLLLYNIATRLYFFSIYIASIFNQKAAEWAKGRQGWKDQTKQIAANGSSWIWIHCASLGEFEQGRPLIEAIRKSYPQHQLLLTFFSPSGYLIRRDYPQADAVMYIAADTRRNAEYFIGELRPVLAVFVKYEFWYHHLVALRKHHITTILVSATFRRRQLFFQWYGKIMLRALHSFSAVFVQDDSSAKLLGEIGVNNVYVSGDTRYDRVAEIAAKAERVRDVEIFLSGGKALIAGSVWQSDAKVIRDAFVALPQQWKLIVAPHEVDEKNLRSIENVFKQETVFFSRLKEGSVSGKRILVIDNIGMLASLYRYGDLAYVGGGFQKGGIHNVLEPAVFGLPVIFGPCHAKFVEAVELKNHGYAFSVSDSNEFSAVLTRLAAEEKYRELRASIKKYMASKTGATKTILTQISRNKWL